jgi:hypothetical protein
MMLNYALKGSLSPGNVPSSLRKFPRRHHGEPLFRRCLSACPETHCLLAPSIKSKITANPAKRWEVYVHFHWQFEHASLENARAKI